MEIEKIGIGKATEMLKPLDVVIDSIEEVSVNFGEEVKQKLVLHCKYPAMEKQISIGKTAYLKKGKSREISGLWITLDDGGLIHGNSALACMLTHYGAGSIGEMKGKTIQTVVDDEGYLAVKSF